MIDDDEIVPEAYYAEQARLCYECSRPHLPNSSLCQECSDQWAKIQAAQKTFEADHPKFCRACMGQGLLYNPGVYRYRDGSGEPPSTDPCRCLMDDVCPWCASVHTIMEATDGSLHCAMLGCGWDEQQSGYPDW